MTTNTGRKEKFAQKIRLKTMFQPVIHLAVTKKRAIMQKSRTLYENWLYQEQRPFEENKPIEKANCRSMDKGCELSANMLSYWLTEIRLANLKNPLSFLKKIIFRIHSQHKLSTKRLNSLFCNYLKNELQLL